MATSVLVIAGSCSLDNQEGPDVTCADLDCGRVNACQEGIIAQCENGRTVRFHVCSTDDICKFDWQVPGEYRCEKEDTDCEGCRPDREEGCAAFDEGGSGPGGSGAGGN